MSSSENVDKSDGNCKRDKKGLRESAVIREEGGP